MIESEIAKVTRLGNDIATSFSISPLVVFEPDPGADHDLYVVKVAVDGTETEVSEGTGTDEYAVVIADYPGTGSITYPASGTDYLATGEKLVIKRKLSLLQPIVLENQGGYFPDTLEQGLDRAIMILIQQQEELDRALKLDISSSQTPEELLQSIYDAETGAQDAQTAAETAQTAAETAQTAAETAQGLAEEARDVAIAAAGSAVEAPGYTGNGDKVPVVNSGGTGWLYKTAAQMLSFLGIGSASEAGSGLIEIATAAEVTAGTDDQRAITPKKLTEFAPGSATPDTANDKVLFLDASDDDKIKQGDFPATSGAILATGYQEYTTNAGITAVIPYDDTIPQSTEGTQILSVTVNVPTTTAEVIVMAQGTTSRTSGTATGAVALFDGGANAIAANIGYIDNINAPKNWNIHHRYVPGSAGNKTFTVRTGPDAGTIRLNGTASARYMGGVSKATLLVIVREP